MNFEDEKQVVTELFDGVKDKCGAPYAEHCFAVAEGVRSLHAGNGILCPDVILAAALHHDTVEDLGASPDFAGESSGFKAAASAIIGDLTIRPAEKYESYISRVGTDWIASIIKLADLKHNIDPQRVPPEGSRKGWKDLAYRKAVSKLEARVNAVAEKQDLLLEMQRCRKVADELAAAVGNCIPNASKIGSAVLACAFKRAGEEIAWLESIFSGGPAITYWRAPSSEFLLRWCGDAVGDVPTMIAKFEEIQEGLPIGPGVSVPSKPETVGEIAWVSRDLLVPALRFGASVCAWIGVPDGK